MDSPYLTMPEAAKYLRMDKLSRYDEVIGRWARSRRLKAVKRGHAWLFKTEWLDRFLEKSV